MRRLNALRPAVVALESRLSLSDAGSVGPIYMQPEYRPSLGQADIADSYIATRAAATGADEKLWGSPMQESDPLPIEQIPSPVRPVYVDIELPPIEFPSAEPAYVGPGDGGGSW